MSEKNKLIPDLKYGVVAIGNALVDVLAPADDAFLAAEDAAHGMKRGSMNLITQTRAVELYAGMKAGVETSGGSVANTAIGFASFGGRSAYIGKVAQDKLGETFRTSMRSHGVDFDTAPLIIGAATGRCMILVSDDGQRTMNTFLGAAVELKPEDIDMDVVGQAEITYLEGYLFDPPHAKAAFRHAAKIAHQAGRQVSLSLSDAFCVDRHRDDFLELVGTHVDLLFANEAEIMALYQTATFEQALKRVGEDCPVAVLTRGAKGSVIISDGKAIEVAAAPVKKVVDTTGAGDQFAAGFLYGYTEGMSLEVCGRLGALAAAEVISHIGPRPETSYASLLKKAA